MTTPPAAPTTDSPTSRARAGKRCDQCRHRLATTNHDAGGRGVTYTYLCALTSGRKHPSRRSLEVIAAALDLDPGYSPQYRLAQLRDQLNPKRVGFHAAWRRYLELAQ